MTQRPFDTGRRDSLGRRIKESDAVEKSPPDPGVLPDGPSNWSTSPAVCDALVEARHCVELAAEFVARFSYDQFMSDEIIQGSGSMLIIRLREVAKRLPEEFRGEHPNIPWKALVGMGNILAHEYATTADPALVWNALVNDFPELDVFDNDRETDERP